MVSAGHGGTGVDLADLIVETQVVPTQAKNVADKWSAKSMADKPASLALPIF